MRNQFIRKLVLVPLKKETSQTTKETIYFTILGILIRHVRKLSLKLKLLTLMKNLSMPIFASLLQKIEGLKELIKETQYPVLVENVPFLEK